MSSALWTDDGVTESMIDRRVFPRILALAEQMWHSGNPEILMSFMAKYSLSNCGLNSRGIHSGLH